MSQISKGSGHCFTFPSSFLRCCLALFITVGPISRTVAAPTEPVVTSLTPVSECGESPLWYDLNQRVYFIDGAKKCINRLQPDNKEYATVQIETEESLKFLVPFKDKPDVFIVGFDGQIGHVWWDGLTTNPIKPTYFVTIPTVPGELIVCGKADTILRLWVGTSFPVSPDPGAELKGKLYMVEQNLESKEVRDPIVKLDNIGVPTGLAWNPDNTILYVVDSTAATIVQHKYSIADGNLVDGKVLYDFAAQNIQGVPNGITVDTDGNLWVACMKSNLVLEIDPNGAKVTEIAVTDAMGITNVAFGGKELKELYVTTAADPTLPNSGALFSVTETGSTGILANAGNEGPEDPNLAEQAGEKVKDGAEKVKDGAVKVKDGAEKVINQGIDKLKGLFE